MADESFVNNLCPLSAPPAFNLCAFGIRGDSSSWNVTTFFSAEDRLRDDEPLLRPLSLLPQSLSVLFDDICDPTDPTSVGRAHPYSMPCCCLSASRLALRCSSSSAVDLTIFSGWW